MTTPRPADLRRVAAAVRGRVQGVGFRWFVLREAAQLGLVGWVANAPDGSVRLEAEGGADGIDRLLALLREGPPGAYVEDVSASDLSPLGAEARFSLRAFGHGGD